NPVVLEQHLLAPATALASDGASIFWIDSQAKLWRASVNGGTPALLTSQVGWVQGFLYVDSTKVYFIGSGGIASVPKAGGVVSTLAATSGSIVSATVAAGVVYWVEQDEITVGPNHTPSMVGEIESAPLTGGVPTMLAPITGFVTS